MNIDFSQLLPRLVFPNEIYFKKGSLIRLKYLKKRRIVIFTGRSSLQKSGNLEKINNYLKSQQNQILTSCIDSEPKIDELRKSAEKLLSFNPNLIIACGGGSVIDSAKILKVILENFHLNILKYKTPHSLPKAKSKIKLIAIPTTNGSGAEVSWTAPIIDTKLHKKIPLTSLSLLPDLVILDPELTLTLPPKLTATATLDSLTHALEAYCSTISNNLTKLYAITTGNIVRKNLSKILEEPNNIEGREMLQYAGMFGGIAQNTSSTGAIHALSHTLGGLFDIPHFFGNVIFLPPILRENAKHSPKPLEFLNEIGFNSLRDFLNWFEKIKKISNLEVSWSKLLKSKHLISLDQIALQAQEDICMKTNPYKFSLQELIKILKDTR